MTDTIYDWPLSPFGQTFRVGRSAADGGITVSGARVLTPEPGGGLAVLDMEFNAFGEDSPLPRLISGLMSLIGGGTIWRVRLAASTQLISARDLGVDPHLESSGLPWSNGQPWSNGGNWAFGPGVVAAADAAIGATSIALDMGDLGKVLQFGHAFGHRSRAYLAMGVSYAGKIATVTVAPPLRVAMTAGQFVTFRPKMLGTVVDPSAFVAPFMPGRLVMPPSISFLEALP